MENIEYFKTEPLLENTRYINRVRIVYKQDGVEKTWDALKELDSVYILLYNISRNCFVLVSQFRPAVFLASVRNANPSGDVEDVDVSKHPGTMGITYELCAGLIDKEGVSVEEHAKAEVLEECGYDIPIEALRKITTYRSGVGISGAIQTMFYVEVTDEMRVSQGGGLAGEGELIKVLDIPIEDGKKLLDDDSIPKPVGVMYAIMWFYENIKRPGSC